MFWWEAVSSLYKFKHYRQPVFSPPKQPRFRSSFVLHTPRQSTTERGKRRGFRTVSLTSAESGPRARGWKASLWPEGVSWRNKKSDTTNHGQLRPTPLTRKLSFPLRLLEALRKSGCRLANFARVNPSAPKGFAAHQTTAALQNLHLYLFQTRAAPPQGPPSTTTPPGGATRPWPPARCHLQPPGAPCLPFPPRPPRGRLRPGPGIRQAAAVTATCP